MQEQSRFKTLMDKYLVNTISANEQQELFAWLMNKESQPELEATITDILQQSYEDLPQDHRLREGIFAQVQQQNRLASGTVAPVVSTPAGTPIKLLRSRYMAAAILLAVITGTWLWNHTNKQSAVRQAPVAAADIAPGREGAILTLADGKTIVLDTLADGSIAIAGNTEILKANGQLSYAGNTHPANVTFNTLTTPPGRQYHLVLPDGTGVWLNAATSLKFPTAFTGNQRLVELTGEAYFEVTANAAAPFQVQANGMEVRVLGTHFNINAYDNEPGLHTTLLEGSVRVNANAPQQLAPVILQPGQQAVFNRQHNDLSVEQPDTKQVMAWKNGQFAFNHNNIEAVMRQVARWYNVEVEYRGKFSGDDFGGKIPRTEQLSKVLEMLEMTGIVHFEVQGRKVIVTPA